jgi:phenylacetate-CoA ligase
MYSSLFRNVLLPAYESGLRGRQTLQTLGELEQSQWHSPEALAQLSFLRLLDALGHAERHVPFYRKRFAEFGVRVSQIKAPEDLAAFPIVTKDDVRKHPQEFVAENFRGHLHRSSTGGSTGASMTFHYDHATYEKRVAAAIRANRWAGAEIGNREVHVWGRPPGEREGLHTWKRSLVEWVWRHKFVSSFHLHQDKLGDTFRAIGSYAPRAIIGYTTPLYLLARAAIDEQIVMPAPLGIITSAERLFEHQREVIEKGFGAPVFDRYGCREVMLIGAECQRHAGLHLNVENVFVELYRGGRPAPIGTAGEVLLSDLQNRAMPLLRYRNDDVATAKAGLCPCGRGLPLLASVEGRVLDLIVGTNGRIVAGEAFVHLLKEYPIDRFQVHQRADRSTSLRIIAGRGFRSEQATEIDKRLRTVLGHDAAFCVELVDDIPLTISGKHRVTKSDVPVEIATATSPRFECVAPVLPRQTLTKKYVAHVVLSLRTGGLERVVLQLVEHMDRSRFEPIVVALEGRGDLAPELERLGVPLHVFPRKRGLDVQVLSDIANLLEQKRIALVHTHNPSPHVYGSFAASLVRHRGVLRPTVVHTKHGRNHPDDGRRVMVNRLAAAFSDRVVAVSDDARKVAIEVERIEPHRLVTIRNGVDTKKVCPGDGKVIRRALGIADETFHIGCVARLSLEKDHATLLHALSILHGRMPHVCLTLVGDGALRTELEELAATLGLRDAVRFVGSTNDVASLLPSFDVFALSSRTEGTSLTLLEAAAAALPIVATRVGGNAEIVADGETGILVPAGQPRVFAEALETIAMREDRRLMGARGRADMIARYDLAKMVAAYDTLYTEVLRFG